MARFPSRDSVAKFTPLTARVPSLRMRLDAPVTSVAEEPANPTPMVRVWGPVAADVISTFWLAAISMCVSQAMSASKVTVVVVLPVAAPTALIRSRQFSTAAACLEASPSENRARPTALGVNTILAAGGLGKEERVREEREKMSPAGAMVNVPALLFHKGSKKSFGRQ